MNINTITIPKKEYQQLADIRIRYERLRQALEKNIFTPPPTRKKQSIIEAFGATGKYNEKFLKSIERGLGRSSYFKK